MKKSVKLVSLLLTLVMLVATLASCGGPASDPDKAVEALKKNEYTAAKDSTIIPTALRLLGVNDIDTVVSGSKAIEATEKEDAKVETVTIIYFSSSDAAKTAMDKVEDYADNNKSKDTQDSDWVFKQSGKMIYFGTKAGVKAAG